MQEAAFSGNHSAGALLASIAFKEKAMEPNEFLSQAEREAELVGTLLLVRNVLALYDGMTVLQDETEASQMPLDFRVELACINAVLEKLQVDASPNLYAPEWQHSSTDVVTRRTLRNLNYRNVTVFLPFEQVDGPNASSFAMSVDRLVS
jgi:hypothetical protein